MGASASTASGIDGLIRVDGDHSEAVPRLAEEAVICSAAAVAPPPATPQPQAVRFRHPQTCTAACAACFLDTRLACLTQYCRALSLSQAPTRAPLGLHDAAWPDWLTRSCPAITEGWTARRLDRCGSRAGLFEARRWRHVARPQHPRGSGSSRLAAQPALLRAPAARLRARVPWRVRAALRRQVAASSACLFREKSARLTRLRAQLHQAAEGGQWHLLERV